MERFKNFLSFVFSVVIVPFIVAFSAVFYMIMLSGMLSFLALLTLGKFIFSIFFVSLFAVLAVLMWVLRRNRKNGKC